MSFETSVFTDVSSDESIDGSSGFRFQAVSGGFRSETMQWITRHGLHEVDTAWSAEPEAQPETCAYVVADGFRMLSRGRSTGQTLSGRAGNQLTQTITTSDPEDFIPYRPAQLYGAANWRLEKAEGKEVPPWVTPLTVKPAFEPDGLRDWLTGDPWAVQTLPVFVEHFQRALVGPPTLLLIARDLEMVMRWIAIGSLVSGPEVLDLEFRALVRYTGRERGRVLGVSPDFGMPDLTHVSWLDLEAREVSAVEVSPVAAVVSRWFLEHEPLDSLEAVELLHRWRRGMSVDAAVDAVRIAVLDAEELDRARTWRAATAMVTSQDDVMTTSELEDHLDGIMDAVLDHSLRGLDDVRVAGAALRRTKERGLAALSNVYALQLLRLLSEEPSIVGDWCEAVGDLDGTVDWLAHDDATAAGRLAREALGRVDPDALPVLLSALAGLGPVVEPDRVEEFVERTVDVVLADPAGVADAPDGWWCGEPVSALLSEELLALLREDDPAQSSSLLQGHWDFLAGGVDRGPLTAWLEAGRIARLDPGARAAPISQLVFDPAAWRLLVGGAAEGEFPALVLAWLHRNELVPTLEARLESSLDAVLEEATGLGAGRVLSAWAPLVETLGTRSDLDDSWRERLALFSERRQAVSVGGQLRRVFGKKHTPDDLEKN